MLIADGPRVLSGTSGPVSLAGDALNPADGTTGKATLQHFIVTFDRPVLASSFTPADITIQGLSADGASLGTITATSVVPNAGITTINGLQFATGFLVTIPKQTTPGTYSYAIGPNVNDMIRVRAGTVTRDFNLMDQNANGTQADNNTTRGYDFFSQPQTAAPTAQYPAWGVNGQPFTQTELVRDSQPLIVPGPHVISTHVPGTTTSNDNLATDRTVNSIDLTFDRDMQVSTFTPSDVLQVLGPAGQILGANSPNVSVYAAYNAPVSPSSPVTIAPGTTYDSKFTINDNGSFVIGLLNVRLDIATIEDSSLNVSLIGPDGSIVHLFQGVGTSLGKNFRDTVLSDLATTLIGNGNAPFSGAYAPLQSLMAAFTNKLLQGSWTLEVQNTSSTNAATLNAWSLEATPLNPTASVVARTFRVVFPTQQLSGTYTVTVAPTIQSAVDTANPINSSASYQVDSNYNAGVDVLRGTAAANNPPVPVVYGNATAVPNPALAPGQSITSDITVPDDFKIQGLTLQLNITYPNDPDLSAYLYTPSDLDPVTGAILPTATPIRLFDAGIGNVSGNRANFTNTVFDDSAAIPIEQGGPSFLGTFKPQKTPATTTIPNALKTLGSLDGYSTITGLTGGGAGRYRLVVTNNGTASQPATLNSWSLTFQKAVPSNGLGEPVADRIQSGFRIFTMDPTNPLSSSTWTAMGGASNNNGGNSGRIGGIAIDPSDPTGNTVYAGGASGGIWKTNNFLTTNPLGPTWVPMANFGPTNAVNIGGIAVFGRNNDPNQSAVFVATGEGDTGSAGVGFLRSMDGGATWQLLDSTHNFDASGNLLPINSPQRDHIFVGTTSFKVIVDPRPTVSGDVIVYAALSGGNGGLWRSLNSGRDWQKMYTGAQGQGQCTDVEFDPTSGTVNALSNPAGNIQIVYAAFRGDGVYFSPNQGVLWNPTAVPAARIRRAAATRCSRTTSPRAIRPRPSRSTPRPTRPTAPMAASCSCTRRRCRAATRTPTSRT